jgi:2-oxoglutarate dehydrogenase E2 component (dihydrolipoamide succinyltransferase)
MKCARRQRVSGLISNHVVPQTRSLPKRQCIISFSTNSQKPRSPILTSRSPYLRHSSRQARNYFSTTPHQHAEVIVKVPHMAESISEGTLSTFSKQVGDNVEADEEIASIETDKIDVSVNASKAGVITALFVNEGDTVTVGQQVAKIDTSAEGIREHKSPAKEDQNSAQEHKFEPAPPVEELAERPSPTKEGPKSKLQRESEAMISPSDSVKLASSELGPRTEASQSTLPKVAAIKFSRGESRVWNRKYEYEEKKRLTNKIRSR